MRVLSVVLKQARWKQSKQPSFWTDSNSPGYARCLEEQHAEREDINRKRFFGSYYLQHARTYVHTHARTHARVVAKKLHLFLRIFFL